MKVAEETWGSDGGEVASGYWLDAAVRFADGFGGWGGFGVEGEKGELMLSDQGNLASGEGA